MVLFSPVLQILDRRVLRCKTASHWLSCANVSSLDQWALGSRSCGREKTENRKSSWRQPTYPSCSNQLMFEHHSETSSPRSTMLTIQKHNFWIWCSHLVRNNSSPFYFNICLTGTNSLELTLVVLFKKISKYCNFCQMQWQVVGVCAIIAWHMFVTSWICGRCVKTVTTCWNFYLAHVKKGDILEQWVCGFWTWC